MATISISGKSLVTARKTMRPMRPKPLMPTLIAIVFLLLLVKSKSVSGSENGLGLGDHVLDREAEFLEQLAGRGGFAEAIHADHSTVQANILVPGVGHACFDRHALDAGRQHAGLVSRVLLIENVG